MAERLAYCVPIGLPHSQFVAWSDEDQDLALSWRRREARRCKSCGTLPGEAERHDLIADTAHCEGCSRLAGLRRQVEETVKDHPQAADGLTLTLVPAELIDARDEG